MVLTQAIEAATLARCWRDPIFRSAAREGLEWRKAAPLVYMKLKSPRPKDQADVIEMIKGGIDARQCRTYLAAHAPALAAAFDECVVQAEAEQD